MRNMSEEIILPCNSRITCLKCGYLCMKIDFNKYDDNGLVLIRKVEE